MLLLFSGREVWLTRSLDDAFTKALEKFEKHQSLLSHCDAMDLVVGKNREVDEMLRV